MIFLGNVTYIDIPQDQQKANVLHAYVTFTPPPKDYAAIELGLVNAPQTTGREHMVTLKHKPQSWAPNAKAHGDITVDAKRVDFGVMKSEDLMLGLHTVHSTPSANVQVSVNTHQKRLEVEFSVPSSLMRNGRKAHQRPVQLRYKMYINFTQVTSVVQMQDQNTGEVSLVLSAEAPPLVYRKTDKPLDSHEKGSLRWQEKMLWYRQTEIEQDIDVAKKAKKQLQRDTPIIDIGRWLTYRLIFDTTTSSSERFRKLKEALATHGLPLRTDREVKSQFAATKAMAMWSWLDSPVSALGDGGGDLSSLSDLQQMAHQTIQLPFEVRYQLESCISHGCIHECNIDQAFLESLSLMATESEHGRIRTVKLLEKVVENGLHFYEPKDIFKKVVPNMRNAFRQRQHATHFVKVMTAMVTPTTIYFNAPSLEPSNRVIRHFRQHETRFLRVRFAEEKYNGKIYASEDAQDNEIFTRVKRTMTNGIKVGDRVYEFLAFGNSQFREHGAYFFAATGDLNAAKIRAWMGNFSHIRVVAKYCSRIGQALSTTRATQNKSFKEIKIPDIERNGFCFTDGVGKISPMLAILISSEIGMLKPHVGMGKSEDYPYPSAFQFRMGGCKGVLVVDPSMGYERSVAIRPSQEKFSMMKHTGLEICRISQFTNASLNVQIILVLSALGVEDKVFTDMMDTMLSNIELAMTNEGKAIELLQKNIDLNQMTVQVAQMILDGFMEQQEPFMISCLRLWRSWSLKYLKEKQKIFVEEGAFVLGCIDETATLEGHRDSKPDALPEIFLQVPDREHEGRYKIVEGVCMLARNPSLHPGDIRVVRAVACEKLKHIRDCVVLPQKGDRDIANMCSGGDLDGDDYIVIWDPKLLPKEWNHPPMDYQAPPAVEAEGQINVDHMTSFFVTHMKYNNIGRIAILHRCWADREDEGVKSPQCLKLAELHSRAVDYAKTGQPAELPRELMMGKRPHWYESARSHYHSKKIIGKLFDAVMRADFQPAWDKPFDPRILEAYQLDDGVLEKARDVKEQYDEGVRRIMAKYDIKSEFEVWSTFVIDHCEDFNDYKFVEKIGEEVLTLKERMQKLCHEQISEDEKEQKDWSKKGPFVAAMYTVTAREVEAALAECEQTKIVGGVEIPVREKKVETMPFVSFPWIFPTELGWIANKRIGYSASSLLRIAGSKPVQQAAKTKLRQDILGNVQEPAPLEELVIPDIVGEEFDEEEDLLDMHYTGPKLVGQHLFDKPALPTAHQAEKIPSEGMARDSAVENSDLESDTGVSPSPAKANGPAQLSAPLLDPSSLDEVNTLTSPPPPARTLMADVQIQIPQCTSSGAMTQQKQESLNRTSASEDNEQGDVSDEEEVEEVIIAPPQKKSAFDALEELLAS